MWFTHDYISGCDGYEGGKKGYGYWSNMTSPRGKMLGSDPGIGEKRTSRGLEEKNFWFLQT